MGETENTVVVQEYIQMGQTLMGAEKYTEAVEMFDKALAADTMDKVAYISKGIALANLERYEEAKECFTRAVKIDKTFADAYFQLGNMEFLEGNFEKGVKNYNNAVSFGYQGAELYYNLGLVYEEREDTEEAIRCYAKAAAADETTPVYLIRKATLQLMLGKYEEALQTLEKVRIHFPEIFEGYHLAAAAYTMMEQYEEADNILKNAMELFPDDVDIFFDRLRILVTKGDLENALNMLDKAKGRENTPQERKEMLLFEAQILGQQDKLEEAVRKLTEALEIPEGKERDGEIRYLLMNSYLAMQDYPNLKKTVEGMDRNDTDSPFSLGSVYYEGLALKGMGDPSYKSFYQEAVKYYRNISMKDPSRLDAWLFRAMCCKEAGDYEKALEAADYVLLLQPENGRLHYIKAGILKEMSGREKEAQEELRKAEELGMDHSMMI